MDPGFEQKPEQQRPQPPPVTAQLAPKPPRRKPHPARRWPVVLLSFGLGGSLLVNLVFFAVVGLTGLVLLETDRTVQEIWLRCWT
jgi:hypothetical protein